MQIISWPEPYSPAFAEALFVISAGISEKVEVEIYDDSLMRVIGRKKFTGATSYNVNVSPYLRRQMDVFPLAPGKTTCFTPYGRYMNVKVKAGTSEKSTILTAGILAAAPLQKLSSCPDVLDISPSDRFELSLYSGVESLKGEVVFKGSKKNTTLAVQGAIAANDLSSICISMTDLEAKLLAADDNLGNYKTMELIVTGQTSARTVRQGFVIVPRMMNDVRLCWWNQYGQIDYYTMRMVSDRLVPEKERIRTPGGYKTVSSSMRRSLDMVSGYREPAVMEWLAGISSSPSVWIDTGTEYIPVEITSGAVTVNSEKLSRCEISAVYAKNTIFQHH